MTMIIIILLMMITKLGVMMLMIVRVDDDTEIDNDADYYYACMQGLWSRGYCPPPPHPPSLNFDIDW